MVSRRDVLVGTASVGFASAGFATLQVTALASSDAGEHTDGRERGAEDNGTRAGVDAADHDARGDGVTDDTAALQAALDAAAGGQLTIPPGTYLTNSLNVPADTTVRILPDATLKWLPQDFHVTDPGGVLNIRGEADAPITGVVVTGGGAIDASAGEHQNENRDTEGIELDDAKHCVIRDITIINAPSDGIDLDNCEECLIERVLVSNCGGHGVHISHGNRRITVSHSLAVGCGYTYERGGFDSHAIVGQRQTSESTFIGCVAIDCHYGFALKADRNTVTYCRAEGSTTEDLRVHLGAATTVTGFESDTSRGGGIAVRNGASQVTITNSKVSSPANTGIQILEDTDQVVVTDCEVVGAGGDGIHISGDHAVVVGNNVHGNHGEQVSDTGSGNTVAANGTHT